MTGAPKLTLVGSPERPSDEPVWTDDLQRNKEGKPIASFTNALLIFEHDESLRGLLRYDTFRGRKVKSREAPWGGGNGAWRDVDVVELRMYFERAHGLKFSAEAMQSTVEMVAHRNEFDPLVEYLEKLPAWDKTPRVERFFPYYFGAPDTAMNRSFSRMFLISLVVRGFAPGTKVDTMPILVGEQGLRKSSGLKAIVGSRYFSDDPVDFRSRDGVVTIGESWLHEIPELDSMKRTEATSIKAFLTKTEDKFRPFYGRELISRQRRAVFAGTTNEPLHLPDDASGVRRFWSIDCFQECRVEEIERDRDQIFAEAVALYRAGHLWYYSERDEIASQIRDNQASRQNEHPWLEAIQSWVYSPENAARRMEGFTSLELLRDGLKKDVEKITKGDAAAISHCMQALGWKRSEHRIMRDNARVRVYLPAPKPTIEAPAPNAPAPASKPAEQPPPPPVTRACKCGAALPTGANECTACYQLRWLAYAQAQTQSDGADPWDT